MALTLSKAELVKLYVLVTGESERVFNKVFTDAQALAIAESISEAVSGASDLVSTDQIITAAAAMAPADVFAGAPGIAKLDAWAVANIATIILVPAVHTALEANGWNHA